MDGAEHFSVLFLFLSGLTTRSMRPILGAGVRFPVETEVYYVVIYDASVSALSRLV